jgi:hypothetical protein
MPDYSLIDQPLLLNFLFYPRKDFQACPQNAFDSLVPVDDNVFISCRFYVGDKIWPWILFFHGNGEVVSDYDEIAPFYHQKKLNLVVADYRGYGASGGSPTFANLIKDAHSLFKAIKKELFKKGLGQELWIMGRSLGSISALELAYHYSDKINGLIIESGFASVVRLIRHLGLPSPGINLNQFEQECLDIVRRISIPALIIHGQYDHLVPLQEARNLFEYLGTTQKQLVIIPNADHNNIMFADFAQYFETIQRFIRPLKLNDAFP